MNSDLRYKIVLVIMIAMIASFFFLSCRVITGNVAMRMDLTKDDLMNVEGTQRILVPLVPVEQKSVTVETFVAPEVKQTFWERLTARFKEFGNHRL